MVASPGRHAGRLAIERGSRFRSQCLLIPLIQVTTDHLSRIETGHTADGCPQPFIIVGNGSAKRRAAKGSQGSAPVFLGHVAGGFTTGRESDNNCGS